MNCRIQHLVGHLRERELDAMLVSAAENRRYFSGFTGSAGYLLISPDQALLVTDSRYTEQASNQAADFQVVQSRTGWAWLLESLKQYGIRKVGFEGHHVTVATYNSLLDALKQDGDLGHVSLVDVSGIAQGQRAVKDSTELAVLQKAIDASDAAMGAVCPNIQEGMTEKEVAWRMEVAMRDHGADTISFGTIVAAGPNGAMPHHRPSDRPIQKGEPIVIDMGAKVDGYCSDITRTVTVGEPDETFRKIYDIVLGAQLTAIHTVKAGVTGEDCDNLARIVITDAGYGENFGHSLGHGVGLAVHEYPRVSPKSNDLLNANTVFTVEPGIYVPGWGGVRIEDIVILNEGGATSLSRASK